MYEWGKVKKVLGNKIGITSHYNQGWPCYSLKKEGSLNNGMKSFWLKFSDGLNQNLNPPFPLFITQTFDYKQAFQTFNEISSWVWVMILAVANLESSLHTSVVHDLLNNMKHFWPPGQNGFVKQNHVVKGWDYLYG